MSSTKPVLVIGSSGNVGMATVRALAAAGVRTRAGVRDTSSSAAKELSALEGVEVVTANLSDPKAALANAVAGSRAVFVVTPGTENRADLVDVAVAAAKDGKVEHLVVVSVPSVVAAADLLFKRQFIAIESAVAGSGIGCTILRLPMFFENQWANQTSIKGEGKIYGPVDPSKSLSLVTVADVGAAAAKILQSPAVHVGKTYTLVSETTTFAAIADSFTKAIGQKVEYVQVPYPAASDAMIGMGFPAWQVGGMIELLKLVDSGSEGAVVKTSDLAVLLGKAPTSFTSWLAPIAAAFKQ